MAMNSCNCKYIDQDAFSKILNEDVENVDYHYYPVNIKALRIDWIINS